MFPSEAEIEDRLAALRRRREALDREIADLTLYRELGRRLGEPGRAAETETGADPGTDRVSGPSPDPAWAAPAADPPAGSHPGRAARPWAPPPSGAWPQPWAAPAPLRPSPAAADRSAPAFPASQLPIPQLPIPPVAFEDDPVAARRYGRAVIEAAIGVLEAAGRPLHAGEILERLAARQSHRSHRRPVNSNDSCSRRNSL